MSKLNPHQLAIQRAAQLRLAAKNYPDFVRHTFRNFQENWHHTVLMDALDAALKWKRDARHTIIVTPPRHGKSEMVSRRLPAFAMGKHPELEIIQATYSEDLASKMGRDVLKILADPAYKEVFPEFEFGEKRTHTEITTYKGGTCKFVGVGGGVTGRGANIIIVDDPFKSREEADSKSSRDRVWDWFNDDLMTRLEYPYCVVLTHTRWHKDDLAGRLMQREPDKWRVIHLPLIADYEDFGEEIPGYDPREMGDVLWPSVRMKGRIDSPDEDLPTEEELIEDIKEDFETRMASNPYGVNSLDQGRPTAKEGNLIKKDWLGSYGSDPKTMGKFCRSTYISIDANFRSDANNGSYAALVVMGLRKDGSFVVLDAEWARMGFVDLKKAAERMAAKWPQASFLVEAKANGDALMDSLKDCGTTVVPFEPGSESKESRAHNLADVAEAGGLFFPSDAPWLEALLDIVCSFPAGAIDDPVDAMTQAVIKMKKRGNALANLRRITGHHAEG